MKRSILLLITISILISACNKELVLENEVLFEDVVRSQDGKVIKDAVISIYAGNNRYSETTDTNGKFSLSIPHELFPETGFISLNIKHEDYQPKNITFTAPLITEQTYNSNQLSHSLIPCPNCLNVKGDFFSELHHLGDDNYGGPENSQFQKSTDGLETSFKFSNSTEFTQLKLSFEAKGLQSDLFDIPSVISIGDDEIVLFLEHSPKDGSYRNYSFVVDNNELFDSLTFKTTNAWGNTFDYDDWEFTSLYIEGVK